ncbi:DUF6157 family protein [Azospirillum sp. ST 5-10]|uniref:DUF6157 family protein n=1 Tax=unclassified Azospirillum TaxID=2630922 RepID=UPI003F4A077C
MHSTNYFQTLILCSSDCPAEAGTVPTKPGTVAAVQFELVSAAPYAMTSDDLLLAVESRRKSMPPDELERFRTVFFCRPRACLRTSPLVKAYGWGIHSDASGRIAVIGRETDRYAALVQDGGVRKVAGMRSRRA